MKLVKKHQLTTEFQNNVLKTYCLYLTYVGDRINKHITSQCNQSLFQQSEVQISHVFFLVFFLFFFWGGGGGLKNNRLLITV